jgi:hypothetical protein
MILSIVFWSIANGWEDFLSKQQGKKMIINLRFGTAARHYIYYDTDRKRGTLKLWSPHSGPSTGADSIEDQNVSASRSTLRLGVFPEMFFKGDQQTEFSIADEHDIVAMLSSLALIMNGEDSFFTSREGRKITFYWKREENSKKGAIVVKIQYGKAAMLTMGEAHKLLTIGMDILRDLGYSEQEISERLERLAHGSPG